MIRCVMKDWLPRQPWRVCLIRHVAAKVRYFRGDERANPCLHCPQVTDLITEPNNNITEVGMMNKKSERYGTCKDCKTPDSFLFSEKRCRQCHYDARDGKEPGSTVLARRAAQAEKASKPKKRGKTKPETTQDNVGQEKFKISRTPGPEQAEKPRCKHLIGISQHPLMGPGFNVYIGEAIEHREEEFSPSDAQLFQFCPLCGKQLNLVKTTSIKSFQTIFQEAEKTE